MTGGGTAALAMTAGSFGAGSVAPARPQAASREQLMVMDREFDEVFRSSYPRLVRLLTAATDDPELAADCVQEAFVRAHVRWRRIGGYDDPVGWVRRVAVNLVRDHARRTARKRRATDRLAVEEQLQDRTSAPAEQPLDLLAVLRTLPPQQRMAMALHYVEGLPVREVAAEMSLSDGAVKFHLHEGRARLRRTVEGSGTSGGIEEGGLRP